MKVKPRTLKVISVCSECGKPVGATKNDTAYRHGFNRHIIALDRPEQRFQRRIQEDGKKCEGSGKPVIYKRWQK